MRYLTLLAAMLFALGCAEEHDHDHDHGKEHDHEEEHDDHGERHEMGESVLGAFTVKVARLGDIEAGHEGVLDVEVSGGTPAAVRAWVGVESGKGSMKAKLDGDHGYHGHIEVPETLPEGSAVWIEVEDADGKKERGSFKLE